MALPNTATLVSQLPQRVYLTCGSWLASDGFKRLHPPAGGPVDSASAHAAWRCQTLPRWQLSSHRECIQLVGAGLPAMDSSAFTRQPAVQLIAPAHMQHGAAKRCQTLPRWQTSSHRECICLVGAGLPAMESSTFTRQPAVQSIAPAYIQHGIAKHCHSCKPAPTESAFVLWELACQRWNQAPSPASRRSS